MRIHAALPCAANGSAPVSMTAAVTGRAVGEYVCCSWVCACVDDCGSRSRAAGEHTPYLQAVKHVPPVPTSELPAALQGNSKNHVENQHVFQPVTNFSSHRQSNCTHIDEGSKLHFSRGPRGLQLDFGWGKSGIADESVGPGRRFGAERGWRNCCRSHLDQLFRQKGPGKRSVSKRRQCIVTMSTSWHGTQACPVEE